jgi:hypothetical protein
MMVAAGSLEMSIHYHDDGDSRILLNAGTLM